MSQITEQATAAKKESMISFLKNNLVEIITACILAGNVFVVSASVFSRYVFNSPFSWADELARLLLIWLTFFGGAVALKRHSHMNLEAVVKLFKPAPQKILGNFTLIIEFCFLLFLTVKGYELMQVRMNEPSPALLMSMAWFIAPIPLSAMIMLLYIIRDFAVNIRENSREAIIGFCLGLLAIALLFVGRPLFAEIGTMTTLALVSMLLVILGAPIAFSLGIASITYLILNQGIPTVIVTQRMVAGVDSFALLALPFFILAGNLMESGGISHRLVNFASALVGHFKGGLGQVAVVTEILFSGISGSASADVSAVGSMLIPPMSKAGYKREDSAAIISAACAMGVLVPPMIWMIVIGAYFNISIISIFLGSILPALTLAIFLMLLIYLLSRRENWPSGPRLDFKAKMDAFLKAIIPLMMPIIIFGSIRGGIVTVTEGAVIAVLYAILVGMVVYREVSFKELFKHLIESGVVSGMILWLVGAASVFSWILAHEMVPANIGHWIVSVSNSSWLFMILTIIVFIILGGILEGLPALLILAPIFIPIAQSFGMDLVHFSVVIIAATGIGIFIPPIGVGAFIACSVAKIDLMVLAKRYLPYLAALLIGLLIVAFIPSITLILPKLLIK